MVSALSPSSDPASPHAQEHEHVDVEIESDTEGDHYGDYSTRMDELFSDPDEDETSTDGATRSRSQSLDFSGASYRQHLRDVLGSEHSLSEVGDGEEEEEETEDEREAERSFTIDSLQLDHLTVPQTVSRPHVYLAFQRLT